MSFCIDFGTDESPLAMRIDGCQVSIYATGRACFSSSGAIELITIDPVRSRDPYLRLSSDSVDQLHRQLFLIWSTTIRRAYARRITDAVQEDAASAQAAHRVARWQESRI